MEGLQFSLCVRVLHLVKVLLILHQFLHPVQVLVYQVRHQFQSIFPGLVGQRFLEVLIQIVFVPEFLELAVNLLHFHRSPEFDLNHFLVQLVNHFGVLVRGFFEAIRDSSHRIRQMDLIFAAERLRDLLQ